MANKIKAESVGNTLHTFGKEGRESIRAGEGCG